MTHRPALRLAEHGAEHHPAALTLGETEAILLTLAHLPQHRAGVRLHAIAALTPWLETAGPVGRLAAAHLGPAARPVRAVLFDKSPAHNWSLAWHQDRTIVVKARREAPGFGPWTTKAGLLHVGPPWSVLSRLLTLRLHLDPVDAGNAPLLIAPGTHCLGVIPEPAIDAAVARAGHRPCLAAPGDAWLYSTPILHASERAPTPTRRRVLQIDYAAADLPDGLEWLGV